MNKPKLLFVYDMRDTSHWMDGLHAALFLLEEDFDVFYWNLSNKEEERMDYRDADFVLGWGAFDSSVDKQLKLCGDAKKIGLCIGGNGTPAREGYDVLFYETKWVRNFLDLGMFCNNLVHAFGVNTDIYNEIDITVPIVWDYIGVGSFSLWKRWHRMQNKKGTKLVVGEYQVDNEPESMAIVQSLIIRNIMVSDTVSPFDLANLYHWSRTLYMPSDIYGGGERAVLEARACGLNVEIEDDNPKLKELLESPIYDHHYYAEQLKKGIMSVL